MKQITLVTATLGSLDIVVKENTNYPNTFEIGNKRIDFSQLLPSNMNLHNLDEYHIILWDGTRLHCEIVVGSETIKGDIVLRKTATEELSWFE